MARGGGVARKIPDGYLTTKGVATKIGVSEATVKRWRSEGHFPSDRTEQYGGVTVHLYAEASLHLALVLKDGLGTLAERAASFRAQEAV